MILALLLHAFYSGVLAYALATIFGSLPIWLSAFSLVAGAVAGILHARQLLRAHPDFKFFAFAAGEPGIFEIAFVAFVLFALIRHFLWMLFPADFAYFTLSLNNFGDLPLHVNYIRYLASGEAGFPVVNPGFPSELLRYPYGSDLYNALWESLGANLQGHLFAVGLVASLASIVLLRSFAGWWGIGAFFLNGGIAFFRALTTHVKGGWLQGIEWKNLLLTVFVTQRGMLFALPIGLLLLICYRRHLSGDAAMTARQRIALGILWGFLPLFHLHAFVIVSLMLLGIAIEFHGKSFVRHFAKEPMLLAAVLPATGFVLFSTDMLKKSGVAHLHWGWTAPPGDFFGFMLLNFGAWLLLPVAIAFALRSPRPHIEPERRKRLWIEFATYSILFVVFFNVMLAPWDWDNIKILIWPYLGFARLAAVVLEPRLGSILGVFERPAIAALLFSTGFAAVSESLAPPTVRGVSIYSMAELNATAGAIRNVPMSAVFLAAPTHNHPLTNFGRLRAVGYKGHLWSHGVASDGVEDILEKIMAGEMAAVPLAISAGATHLFWGPTERATYGAEPRRPWMDKLVNVSRVKDYEVYDLKSDPAASKETPK